MEQNKIVCLTKQLKVPLQSKDFMKIVQKIMLWKWRYLFFLGWEACSNGLFIFIQTECSHRCLEIKTNKPTNQPHKQKPPKIKTEKLLTQTSREISYPFSRISIMFQCTSFLTYACSKTADKTPMPQILHNKSIYTY